MALNNNRKDREQKKFVENEDGETAVRVKSGSIQDNELKLISSALSKILEQLEKQTIILQEMADIDLGE